MAKNSTTSNPYKVGDIIYTISGYDMTLIDFYEVVHVTPCKVGITELQQDEVYEGFLSGRTTPKPGCYEERSEYEPGKLFKVREDGNVVIPYWPGCSSYSLGRKWDGKPKYFNHCD